MSLTAARRASAGLKRGLRRLASPRRVRGLGATVVMLASLTCVGLTASTAAGGTAQCPGLAGAATGTWQQVPHPPGVTWVANEQLSGDACVLFGGTSRPCPSPPTPSCLAFTDADHAIWRSVDGGTRWQRRRAVPPLSTVFTDRLGVVGSVSSPGVVVGLGWAVHDPERVAWAPQVYVSRDNGTHFRAAAASATGEPLLASVRAAASAAAATGGIYLVLGAPANDQLSYGSSSDGVSLLRSDDLGHSFAPLPGSAGLVPTTVVVNPARANEIWVNDLQPGGAGGAWTSTDRGESFRQVRPDLTVRDLDVSETDDGQTVVLLATDSGVLRSDDDGQSFHTIYRSPAIGVRAVPGDPSQVLVETSSSVGWPDSSGTKLAPIPGLPAACSPDPGSLRGDASAPSSFLLDCRGFGPFRLVLPTISAGARQPTPTPTDPSPTPSGPVPSPTGSTLPATPPVVLGTAVLPDAGQLGGALAFDGTSLYYDQTDPHNIGVVDVSHVDASQQGQYRGSLHLPQESFGLTFDTRHRQLLYTATSSGFGYSLFAYNSADRRSRSLSGETWATPSYDASIDGLAYVNANDATHWQTTLTGGPGQARQVCREEGDPQQASSWTAAGDGGLYVANEDDATVYWYGPAPACALVGVYAHPEYVEAHRENDSQACDAQTFFPRVALWFRDSVAGIATAFQIPSGYCPMPSTLTLRADQTLGLGGSTTVCARLVNATTTRPAAGRTVSLLVGRTLIARTETGADGRICAPFQPGTSGRLRLRATFAGDASLYPARAARTLVVIGVAVPPPTTPQPPPGPRAAGAVPPPPPPVAPPAGTGPAPVAPAAPAPAAAPQAQSQAQAQSQVQAQSQLMAHGVVVPQRETQPQLAFAHAASDLQEFAGDNAFSALPERRRRHPQATPVVGVVLALSACCGFGMARSRAFSRHRDPN